MDIQIGKYYNNKTKDYLLPCLKGHGNNFSINYSNLYKLGIGVHDQHLDGSDIANNRNIFVLIDRFHQPRLVEKALKVFEGNDYFIANYSFGSSPTDRRLMLVFNVPKEYEKSYDNFLKGSYSEMYTKAQINYLFSREDKQEQREVLERDRKALVRHVTNVNKLFNSTVTYDDMVEGEFELPLTKKEEIFNYKKDSEVYFKEDIKKQWQKK